MFSLATSLHKPTAIGEIEEKWHTPELERDFWLQKRLPEKQKTISVCHTELAATKNDGARTRSQVPAGDCRPAKEAEKKALSRTHTLTGR